jgi:hypothetical protein
MCMSAICCCHNGWFALARSAGCISRAKFDDVDDCAIEIIVACLHVGVPIVSLLCTHCVHANCRVEREQQQQHTRRERHRVSIQLCRSAAELCMPQINSTTERVHKRHTQNTNRAQMCVVWKTHSTHTSR